MVAQRLTDREAIDDLVGRYSRAVDRRDAESLRKLFSDDATLDMGVFFKGSASHFADSLATMMSGYRMTMHCVLNRVLIVDGDQAQSEDYCVTYSRPCNSSEQVEIGSRALHLFIKQRNIWRIQHRSVVYDWLTVKPVSRETDEMLKSFNASGIPDHNDLSYSTLPSLARGH
jgi:ketosteroid isomerase-like protein